MVRKLLAVLVMVSWVVLSGYDLLEDLDLPILVGIDRPIEGPQPPMGPGVDLVNDILESGDRIKLRHAELIELFAVHCSGNPVLSFKKVFRLHKIHRVYLI